MEWRVSRKSEREAAASAAEVLERARRAGHDVGGDYGAGRMTRPQKASQAKHIPITPGPDSAGKRIARALWG